MTTPAKRLAHAREVAGYPNPRQAALAMGASYDTYVQHENETRDISKAAALRYAAFYRVSLDWLLKAKGPMRGGAKMVPVKAKVGAGAGVYPIDDHPTGHGFDEVEAPPDADECIAAIIDGDSMYPLKPGWLIFWAKQQDGVPEDCIGQLCVVQVKDGPMLVKDLRKGSRKGRYTLQSWNATPQEDVQLEWASRVIDIRPR